VRVEVIEDVGIRQVVQGKDQDTRCKKVLGVKAILLYRDTQGSSRILTAILTRRRHFVTASRELENLRILILDAGSCHQLDSCSGHLVVLERLNIQP
jgi:hypothetical protein